MGWDQYSHYEDVSSLLGRLFMEGKKISTYTVSIHDNPNKTEMDYNEPSTVHHVIVLFEDGSTIEYVPKYYRATNTDDTGDDYYRYYPRDEVVEVERQSFLGD